ncbi:MAG: LpqB family beta-propeller domain-containing protein [Propionibacteriaceae bacterium]|nr:LpqB family beta-propeller domain-containing protein [Propionibacteriaceae bacterium]
MRRLLLCALVTLTLVGCASLPVTGPVTRVLPSTQLVPRGADIAPGPPLPDASPDQLVAGFLVAMSAGQSGLAVAKKYLTAEALAGWRPEESGIEIYDGTASSPAVTADSARIDAPRIGRIDAAGRFTPHEDRLNHDFGLVREADQWRIGNPPPGLLISHYVFGRYFDAYPVYFFNGDHLVPDLVYLSNGQVTPERLLGALFGGPSRWLAQAVTTAVPDGTRLNDASFDGRGVVQVDLSANVEALNPEERRRLGAQVMWTLSALSRVTSVSLTVGKEPFVIPGQSAIGDLELANLQGFQVLAGAQTDDLFAVSAGRLGRLNDEGAFVPVPGVLGQPGADVRTVALSLDGLTVAAVTAGGALLAGEPNGKAAPVATGITHTGVPQVIGGAIWAPGLDEGGRPVLVRVGPDERAETVTLDGLDGELVSFRIAPGGTRIALVVQRDERRVLLMGVLRKRENRTGIGSLVELRPRVDGAQLTNFDQVGWGGEATMVVLASAAAAGRLAYTVTADGAKADAIGPMGDHDLRGLSALPRKSGLRAAAMNEDARVLRYDARARWQGVNVSEISALAYAG